VIGTKEDGWSAEITAVGLDENGPWLAVHATHPNREAIVRRFRIGPVSRVLIGARAANDIRTVPALVSEDEISREINKGNMVGGLRSYNKDTDRADGVDKAVYDDDPGRVMDWEEMVAALRALTETLDDRGQRMLFYYINRERHPDAPADETYSDEELRQLHRRLYDEFGKYKDLMDDDRTPGGLLPDLQNVLQPLLRAAVGDWAAGPLHRFVVAPIIEEVSGLWRFDRPRPRHLFPLGYATVPAAIGTLAAQIGLPGFAIFAVTLLVAALVRINFVRRHEGGQQAPAVVIAVLSSLFAATLAASNEPLAGFALSVASAILTHALTNVSWSAASSVRRWSGLAPWLSRPVDEVERIDSDARFAAQPMGPKPAADLLPSVPQRRIGQRLRTFL
jgi:hypothetical protein